MVYLFYYPYIRENYIDNITFAGTSNQITATVSAQDTVTFALASNITGLSSITSGAVQILDNRILTTDSTNLILQDIIGVSSAGAITGVSSLDVTTLSGGGTRVATRPFAIAQAVALG